MKPQRSKETLWLSLIMAAVFVSLAVVFIRNNRDPAEQIASMNERIELVNSMRLALAQASESQNNAVLATRELESQRFYQEARNASGRFQDLTSRLAERMKQNGDPSEIELVSKMELAFETFQSIDKQIMDLDTRDSNGKAYDLAFGPARSQLLRVDDELCRVISEPSKTRTDGDYACLRCVSDARIRLLKIQSLLAPHIAEAQDEKMDELEQQMKEHDKGLQQDLDLLRAQLSGDDLKKVENVSQMIADFLSTRAEILRLSRENTSLRSVSMALNEKRAAMLVCQDALAAIENAIRKENIASMIPSGRGQ